MRSSNNFGQDYSSEISSFKLPTWKVIMQNYANFASVKAKREREREREREYSFL